MEAIVIIFVYPIFEGLVYSSFVISSIFREQNIENNHDPRALVMGLLYSHIHFLCDLSMIYSAGTTVYTAVILLLELSINVLLGAACSAYTKEDGSPIIKA